MAEIVIAGIMRAGAYSPNHIGNDAAIFNATADQLRKRGCTVNVYSEEQFISGKVSERIILNMCREMESIHLLQKMEDESDQVEVEIADYLTKVSESRLTSENSQRVRAMFKIVSEVESVADSILNVAKAIYRRNEQKITFPEELSNKLKHMFALVDESIVVMCANLATEYTQVNAKKAYELEQAINDYRTILKQEHLMAIEEKRYEYSMGILYNDLFSECEKIGDYTINVTQAMKEIGHEE